jgi:hypothetical protein
MRRLALMRGVPRYPLDIRAADADIGKLAVAQTGQLAHAAIVALPLADKSDKIGKHNDPLSLQSGAFAGDSIDPENRDVSGIEKQ